MADAMYITYYTHIPISIKNFLPFRPENNTTCHGSPPLEAIPCGFQPGFLHQEVASSDRSTAAALHNLLTFFSLAAIKI
jgi:hypothetical protein